MSREEACVLTNLCMVYDGSRILVQDRRASDWPGITFPGGHVEPGESFVTSVIREVKEETGLDISGVRLCGLQQWTQPDGSYRYIVLFFKTNEYSGELKSSEEGEVFWIDRSELGRYKLANDFEALLEIFENDRLSEHYYWMEDGQWRMENK